VIVASIFHQFILATNLPAKLTRFLLKRFDLGIKVKPYIGIDLMCAYLQSLRVLSIRNGAEEENSARSSSHQNLHHERYYYGALRP
jgi:hypothetical protein